MMSRGRFTSTDHAVGAGEGASNKPHPKRVQVAGPGAVMPEVANSPTAEVAQIIEPEPPPEPPPVEPQENTRPAEGPEAAPIGTVADAAAPNGELPGIAGKLGDPRTMSASDDPNLAARAYASKIQNGQTPVWVRPEAEDGGFVAKMPDGAFITFRPAGKASWRTPASTASVDINDARLSELNAGKVLKLKFPKR